jgi:uncharacterized coiled-coil protein SlyX
MTSYYSDARIDELERRATEEAGIRDAVVEEIVEFRKAVVDEVASLTRRLERSEELLAESINPRKDPLPVPRAHPKFKPGDLVTIIVEDLVHLDGKRCQLESRAAEKVWKLYALDNVETHLFFRECEFVHTADPGIEEELTDLVSSLKDRVETLERRQASLERYFRNFPNYNTNP